METRVYSQLVPRLLGPTGHGRHEGIADLITRNGSVADTGDDFAAAASATDITLSTYRTEILLEVYGMTW
jgi:hypothetical protein